MTTGRKGPTRAHAETLDLVEPILTAIMTEMRELSKKKQDGILSPLKVKTINRVLGDVQQALAGHPSTRYLDLLEEDDLPLNSDAVLVLTQWVAAVDQFRNDFFGYDGAGGYRWKLSDGSEYTVPRRR